MTVTNYFNASALIKSDFLKSQVIFSVIFARFLSNCWLHWKSL